MAQTPSIKISWTPSGLVLKELADLIKEMYAYVPEWSQYEAKDLLKRMSGLVSKDIQEAVRQEQMPQHTQNAIDGTVSQGQASLEQLFVGLCAKYQDLGEALKAYAILATEKGVYRDAST